MFGNAIELAQVIEHTNLKPTATPADIQALCDEARHYSFHAVVVNPWYVPMAVELLKDDDVKVCTVIDFPLGASTTASKVMEAVEAVRSGAAELDVVMNIGLFKAQDYEASARQLKDFLLLTPGAVHKVIIEACYLTDAEKAGASRLVAEVGADFVKTSTGFGPGGATAHDVKIMKDAAIGKASIKASGGIKTLDELLEMVEAGATRIGTSSGVAIVEEFILRNNKLAGEE